MSTNCALLTDTILSCIGIDILNMNDMISPGAFYDYLETEFLKPGSMVISRDVYKYAPDKTGSPDLC